MNLHTWLLLLLLFCALVVNLNVPMYLHFLLLPIFFSCIFHLEKFCLQLSMHLSCSVPSLKCQTASMTASPNFHFVGLLKKQMPGDWDLKMFQEYLTTYQFRPLFTLVLRFHYKMFIWGVKCHPHWWGSMGQIEGRVQANLTLPPPLPGGNVCYSSDTSGCPRTGEEERSKMADG